jgi:hypothetical protein
LAHDIFGNEISVQDAASERAVNDFVEGFVACEVRAANILAAAEEDDSVIVQAYAAAFHMFVESPAGPLNARPFLKRAAESTAPATRHHAQRDLSERIHADALKRG